MRRRRFEDVLGEEVSRVRDSFRDTGSVSEKREEFRSGVLSTGSTLLDLAISGKRIRGGGVPGGIIMEIYGPYASGKTAILAEICASAQRNGGKVRFLDPEARLDQEYARIYGVSLSEEDYYRPNTVSEAFALIQDWEPGNSNTINVIATDSLAALSTEMELDKGDKMGMRRAKEFSEGFRKTARLIAKNNWIVACTNQVREGEYGETTPGGFAIPFYSSLRIRVGQTGKIERKTRISSGKEVSKVIGIESLCYIRKSTVDDPFREAPIWIVFGYGIDDVRGNLQWLKDMEKSSVYVAPDGKGFQGMEQAISHVEGNSLQEKLREQVISLWEEVEAKFVADRKPKIRF